MKRFPGVFVLSVMPLLALGADALAAEGDIHKCKDAQGNFVFQDEPCVEPPPAPAKPKVATAPTAASKPSKATKPPKAPNPAKATKPAATPKPWVAIPPSPRLSQPARHEPAPHVGPVDPRWATPEKTLQTFVGAVKAGDRDLVLSCLTDSALADLGPDLEGLPLEDLRETVGSFTGYVAEGDLGPFWSIRALRADIRPKWIFFERTWYGEWKIGAF